jgi:hypothetical protein
MHPDIDPLLERLMREDERVLRTFVACTPSPLLERAFLGSGLQHLRRCIVAVTSERIVQIAVHRDLTPRGAVSQISWGDVRSFHVAPIRRALVIRFRNGKTQRFSDLSFADAHALRDLLPPLIGHGQMTSSKARESLCAACLTPLRPGSPACPRCHAPMKRRSHAAKLAWWSAGGGYHYLGFPQMALLAGIIDFVFFAALLLSLVSALHRNGLDAAIIVVCITIVFIEWKALIVAHTASLASETTLDRVRRRDGEETLFDVLGDAVKWVSRGLTHQD